MKVLLLDVNCKYSSTGKIVYDLYTQLRADGHEAAIGYGRGPLVEGENIYRFSPKWEVYLHALLTRLTGYTGCFSPVATKRLIRFIEEFRPDVVHLNDMHGYFVNIIPLMNYLKRKGIKTVWTFHCEFMYTGKCGYAYECDKWKTECCSCDHVRDYPQSIFFDHTRKMFLKKREAFQAFDNLVIVSPSQWLSARIKRSFLNDKRIVAIYNGIDTQIFYRRDTARLRKQLDLKNEKVVLAVAPNLLSENKGGDHVLQIAQKMKLKNIKFVMVGIKELNRAFDNNIVPIGFIKDQDLLAEYYSLADVFVICSKRENFPTTCIEALCCGTPVVGYDVGGTAETAQDECGKFVQYGMIDDIIVAITGFLEQDRGEIGMICSAYGKERYTKEHMYRQYLTVYGLPDLK